MAEGEKGEELEFKWGIKGRLGGKKKDAQFYESFTYDGVEYARYDSVYLYKEGEPEPFIGKLIKIWENADKSKKVKILWYFRPCEILNFLDGIETLENELFLAYGEGLGLANINPLKDAVSTSHCSQSNNMEYDMAMEWWLLQERAEKVWRGLFQQHGEEFSKVKEKMKSK